MSAADSDADPKSESNQIPLVEGRDYVVEDGLFVLTRDYLLRRGFCCKSGCRHCPYGYIKCE